MQAFWHKKRGSFATPSKKGQLCYPFKKGAALLPLSGWSNNKQ